MKAKHCLLIAAKILYLTNIVTATKSGPWENLVGYQVVNTLVNITDFMVRFKSTSIPCQLQANELTHNIQ